MGLEAARVFALDDEYHSGTRPTRRNPGQLAHVPGAPQGRRIRKPRHAVLDQRHRLDLDGARARGAAQPEVQTAATQAHFPFETPVRLEGLQAARGEGLGDERVGQLRVHGDKRPGVTHQLQIEARLAFAAIHGGDPAGAPRRQQLAQTSGIGEIRGDLPTRQRHSNSETVLARHKTPRDQRRHPHRRHYTTQGRSGKLTSAAAHVRIARRENPTMKISQLFGRTIREAPADAQIASHQLLVRGGFIRQLGAGIFSYLHLARRSMNKLEAILREEMEAIGGQEVTLPVVHPADIWKRTGRWYGIGSEMGRFHDKNDRDMVLAMTHEEVVADLLRTEIKSYKDLPRLIYHIQTKWRDDPRPRGGLIRVREFTMKDSYSLDATWEGLDAQYEAHYRAYFNIFRRCGLPVVAVSSDVGMMGGQMAHEYMYLTPIGEDTILLCEECDYVANRQVARFRKPVPIAEEPRLIEKVATPGVSTIDSLAEFLGLPTSRTAKVVLLVATVTEGVEDVEKLVFAVIRGDMDVNETKLTNALGARDLRPATDEEIRAVGAVPGYASPVGLVRPTGVTVVVDELIPVSPNLVAGANESDAHLLNVNYGRDYQADIVADIAAAEDGYPCPECGAPLHASRGVEVGNIFKLGARYSEAAGCAFLDEAGREQPVIMGSYGIGVGRLLACIAEEHHDEFGLIWPMSVAPFQAHIVVLHGNEDQAEELYNELQAAGVEVLYDDRNERAGVKFNDADLIGIPIRLTVSKRAIESGGVEMKLRSSPERTVIARDEVVGRVKDQIETLLGSV